METLIVQGDSDQISTLKAFLRTVGIEFKTEADATDYLLSSSANKKELIDSINEANEGKTKKVSLDDIWK
jgi:hypothetical protein